MNASTITFEKKGVTFTITNNGHNLWMTANAGQFLTNGDYGDHDVKQGKVVIDENNNLVLDSRTWFRMPDGVNGSGFAVSTEVIEWVKAQTVTPEISYEQKLKNEAQAIADNRISEKPEWMSERDWFNNIFALPFDIDENLTAVNSYDQRRKKAQKEAIESGEPVFLHSIEKDRSGYYIGESGWMMPDGTLNTKHQYNA